MSDCDSVIRPPPPSPCTIRIPINAQTFGASAQPTEPAIMTRSAAFIMRVRPSTSPRRP